MRRKYLLILLAIYIFALPLVLFIISKAFSHAPTNSLSPTPTITSSHPTPLPSFSAGTIAPSTAQSALAVTDTSPVNGQQDVPADTAILIQFNQPIQAKDVPFTVSPNFQYSVSAQDNVLTITPKQPLQGGTTFNFYITVNAPKTYFYSFTTAQVIPTAAPTPDQSGEDAYVASRMPFDTQTYSASASYENGHYYFTVIAKGDPTTAKNDFIVALKSIGVTDEQIQSLDIRYQ